MTPTYKITLGPTGGDRCKVIDPDGNELRGVTAITVHLGGQREVTTATLQLERVELEAEVFADRVDKISSDVGTPVA